MSPAREGVNGVALKRSAKVEGTLLERHPLVLHGAKLILGLFLAGIVALFSWGLFDLRDTARDNQKDIKEVPAIKVRLRSIELNQSEQKTTLKHQAESLKRIESAVGASK